MVMDHVEVKNRLRGSMTALVTPFRNGEVDWDALAALIERQIAGGSDWLVPCGTTGESPTLTAQEHARIIERVCEWAGGRVPVLAGTGSNDTRTAIERTKHAVHAGANAALVVAPYYNRPTPEGLFRHYAAIAEAVDLPLVVYNVPARTGIDVHNDVIVRLREAFSHVVGLKHATGRLQGVTDLLTRSDIAVLSGDDALTWPLIAIGVVGVISVISNLAPELLKSLVDAGLRGDVPAVKPLHRKLYMLAEGMGRLGSNPVPIKTAMAINGLLVDEFRLPLCAMGKDEHGTLVELLRRHELLDNRRQVA